MGRPTPSSTASENGARRWLFGSRESWCIIRGSPKGRAMGRILYGSTMTTEAVRRAIQNSQESGRVLASRFGINPLHRTLGLNR